MSVEKILLEKAFNDARKKVSMLGESEVQMTDYLIQPKYKTFEDWYAKQSKQEEVKRIGDGRIVIGDETYVNENSNRVQDFENPQPQEKVAELNEFPPEACNHCSTLMKVYWYGKWCPNCNIWISTKD